MNNTDDLITLQREYIKLLGDEINDLISYATVHGWKSSNVEKGNELRAKIAMVEKRDISLNDMNHILLNIIKSQDDYIDLIDMDIEKLLRYNPTFDSSTSIVQGNIRQYIKKMKSIIKDKEEN